MNSGGRLRSLMRRHRYALYLWPCMAKPYTLTPTLSKNDYVLEARLWAPSDITPG